MDTAFYSRSSLNLAPAFRAGHAAARKRWLQATVLALGLVLTGGLEASAAEWAQFRGSRASGVDSEVPAPVHWDVNTGDNVRWRAAIPGLGHSSPIIWKDRIYLSTATGPGESQLKVGLYGDIEPANDDELHQWHLLALDRIQGRVLWDKVEHEAKPRSPRHPKSSHCSSTPATDGQHLVAIFGSEGLFCFDMDGHLLWKRDLGVMDSGYYQVPSAQWGFASSPVIHADKVVVLCDVLTDPFLAAFDLASGQELWRVKRDDVPTWGTPALAEVNGKTQILVNGWRHSGAYELDTGKEIWRLKGGGDIPVPTPILDDTYVFMTSGHGGSRPIRAIRLDATGDITPADPGATNRFIPWTHPRLGNYMQTPILVGGRLYACFDNSVLTCLDALSGRIFYNERIGSGAEGFTASPVSDGRHLFFPSEEGNVYVVAAGPELQVVSTNRFHEACMATPALAHGTLLFRTQRQLFAIGNDRK